MLIENTLAILLGLINMSSDIHTICGSLTYIHYKTKGVPVKILKNKEEKGYRIIDLTFISPFKDIRISTNGRIYRASENKIEYNYLYYEKEISLSFESHKSNGLLENAKFLLSPFMCNVKIKGKYKIKIENFEIALDFRNLNLKSEYTSKKINVQGTLLQLNNEKNFELDIKFSDARHIFFEGSKCHLIGKANINGEKIEINNGTYITEKKSYYCDEILSSLGSL